MTLVNIDTAPNADLLKNPEITSPFVAVKPSTGIGKISGVIAHGWQDNSDWANVRVRYSEERNTVRSHKSCQRIDVQQVLDDGRMHFYQPLNGMSAGQGYRVSIWLRESVDVPIEVAVRQLGAPYQDIACATITPGDGWKMVSFHWYATGDAPLGLYIRVTQPVTLWVADASVKEIVPVAAPEGNLLVNGSFETGLAGGWSVWNSSGRFLDQLATLDRTTAFAGKSSLKMPILPTLERMTDVELSSPPVEIRHSGAYTASVALKVQNEPTTISVSLKNTKVSQSFVIGNKWQRVSVTGILSPGPTALIVRAIVSPDKEDAIWVDATELHFSSTPTPKYEPAHPVEMNLTSSQPGHVYLDKAAAVLHFATAGTVPPGSRLHVTVTDLYGNIRALPPVLLTKSTVTVPSNGTRRYGMFKATAVVCDANGRTLSASVDCTFACLPKPRNVDPSKSFFGVHMPLLPAYYPIARAIGARWVRLHDASLLTKWAVVQPNQAPIQYFDEPIASCRKAGLAILGTLDGAPAWTTAKPNPSGGYMAYFYNNPDGPNGMKQWQQYVTALVAHYKGLIDCWEVWNEPWNLADRFFPGTATDYGALLKSAYLTAKKANPKTTIVGIDTYRPIPSIDPEFTKQALQASGSAYYDVFSYHDYTSDTVADAAHNVQLVEAQDFRSLQKQYGGGPVKPMWTTEGGVGPGVMSMYQPELDGATLLADQARMVLFLVGLMAAGSQRFFLYTFFLHPKGVGITDLLALEHDRAIRPQLAAWAILASLVDGAGTPKIDNSMQGVSIFHFPVSEGKQVTVFWSHDGKMHRIPCPKKAALLDIQGNQLATAPSFNIGPIPVYAVRGS